MANLIANLNQIFADTFGNTADNTDQADGALRDINDSLVSTINGHIASPTGNASFISVGFGTTWKSSYSFRDLPTDVLISHADWIDPLISPILADAVAQKVTLLATLMASAPPPVAQAASAIVAATLGPMPGGAGIASGMLSSISSAVAVPGGIASVPGLVSTALIAMSGIITGARLAPATAAEFARTLHFQLQNVGVPGAGQTPAQAWSIIKAQILTIPPNPILRGELGPNFWNAILITINQAIPGVRVN